MLRYATILHLIFYILYFLHKRMDFVLTFQLEPGEDLRLEQDGEDLTLEQDEEDLTLEQDGVDLRLELDGKDYTWNRMDIRSKNVLGFSI